MDRGGQQPPPPGLEPPFVAKCVSGINGDIEFNNWPTVADWWTAGVNSPQGLGPPFVAKCASGVNGDIAFVARGVERPLRAEMSRKSVFDTGAELILIWSVQWFGELFNKEL